MKKKSAKRAAQRFRDTTLALDAYCGAMEAASLSKQDVTWAYEGAVVKLAVAFEKLMLEALVSAVNNDTAQMSATLGITFPKHLSNEVCEFIVTRGRFFDFQGRSGLIGILKAYLPETHYLVTTVKRPAYAQTLNRLVALRNFAAHESSQSKHRAQAELGVHRISSAGAWVKRQGRFLALSSTLRKLAADIETAAPY